jgi:hypothetical protein
MPIYALPGPIIPAGESISNAVDCGGNQILRIVTPSGWDRAALSFQLSPDGAKFNDLYWVQLTGGKFLPFEAVVDPLPDGAVLVMPPQSGLKIFWIRFRSGTKAVPVVQSNERMFQIITWVPDAGA